MLGGRGGGRIGGQVTSVNGASLVRLCGHVKRLTLVLILQRHVCNLG